MKRATQKRRFSIVLNATSESGEFLEISYHCKEREQVDNLSFFVCFIRRLRRIRMRKSINE
ncbi:hypothetical protein SERLA73DRAFT_188501, partial [Serpula lacrymans var. lacrymans S7.3]